MDNENEMEPAQNFNTIVQNLIANLMIVSNDQRILASMQHQMAQRLHASVQRLSSELNNFFGGVPQQQQPQPEQNEPSSSSSSAHVQPQQQVGRDAQKKSTLMWDEESPPEEEDEPPLQNEHGIPAGFLNCFLKNKILALGQPPQPQAAIGGENKGAQSSKGVPQDDFTGPVRSSPRAAFSPTLNARLDRAVLGSGSALDGSSAARPQAQSTPSMAVPNHPSFDFQQASPVQNVEANITQPLNIATVQPTVKGGVDSQQQQEFYDQYCPEEVPAEEYGNLSPAHPKDLPPRPMENFGFMTMNPVLDYPDPETPPSPTAIPLELDALDNEIKISFNFGLLFKDEVHSAVKQLFGSKWFLAVHIRRSEDPGTGQKLQLGLFLRCKGPAMGNPNVNCRVGSPEFTIHNWKPDEEDWSQRAASAKFEPPYGRTHGKYFPMKGRKECEQLGLINENARIKVSVKLEEPTATSTGALTVSSSQGTSPEKTPPTTTRSVRPQPQCQKVKPFTLEHPS